MPDCPLCTGAGGELIWSDVHCRVVAVQGAEHDLYPGFCRVIWTRHVAEMSDLTDGEAAHLMARVLIVERVLRRHLAPDKINLASLGNQVPHLHWHVIPRWQDDSRFPDPIWASERRATPVRKVPDPAALRLSLAQALQAAP